MVDLILLIPVGIVLASFLYFLLQKPKDDEKVVAYLLDDANFERNFYTGACVDARADGWTGPGGKYLGHAIFSAPREGQTVINPTGPPGSMSGLYYSLMFQLGKWEFKREKSEEWIEVSPVHGAYYQLTMKQKEELEGRIKAGLASASQSVADMELLKHDQRKYKEFLHYFGYDTDDTTGEVKKDEKKRDEHSLKAMFIDLVDAHTGEQIAMKSIVSRWPTLIVDFQKLEDSDLDADKIKTKLNISKAEAVVLSTKNRLYQEWKRMFEPQLKERYKRITELVKSRQKSVEQYREWLKPVIARHKMIEEGLGSSGGRKALRTLFIPAGAQATSVSEVTMWAWRDTSPIEMQKGGTERLALENTRDQLPLHWEWTKKNLVFHPKHGLVVKYPWITEEWVKQKREEILNKKPTPTTAWILPHKLYYAFIIIKVTRVNIRLASGAEVEDTLFDVNAILMSQNALFVKQLELIAKQEEFDRYVDELLGVEKPIPGSKPEYTTPRKEDVKQRIYGFLEYFSIPFQFIKGGPYERDFEERITKVMIASMAGNRYQPIVQFIKTKINMGD